MGSVEAMKVFYLSLVLFLATEETVTDRFEVAALLNADIIF